jgi:uncharacterized protein
LLKIYIDADACPVKDEIYKVAQRYQLEVFVVSNRPMKTPLQMRLTPIVVGGKADEADDWIVEHAETNDIVITGDIPLADRALKKGAKVLGPKGREFTEDSIGDALATREIMNFMRESGQSTPHHEAFEKKDRSHFLSKLDQIIQQIKRKG